MTGCRNKLTEENVAGRCASEDIALGRCLRKAQAASVDEDGSQIRKERRIRHGSEADGGMPEREVSGERKLGRNEEQLWARRTRRTSRLHQTERP